MLWRGRFFAEAPYFLPIHTMFSFRRLLRLVFFGPGPKSPYAQPPIASERGATDTVEVWRGGLCASISWQPAKFSGQGTHVYRVSVSRWYQDRERIWRNSPSLHAEDLPQLPALFAECVQKLSQ